MVAKTKKKIVPKSGLLGMAAKSLQGRGLKLLNQERKALGKKPLKKMPVRK